MVSVGSHDTASAVVAVPFEPGAYISAGTWSLVGVELQAPVLSEAALTANFTNEGGVDGATRFLRNVIGLWVLTQAIETWGEGDIEAVLTGAAALPPVARSSTSTHPSSSLPATWRLGFGTPASARVRCWAVAAPQWPGACSTAWRWPTAEP